MWTTNFYRSFFQKYFVVHEQLAVENSFSTYVCYAQDGLFWWNLYIYLNSLRESEAYSNMSLLQEIRLYIITWKGLFPSQ